MSGRAGRPRGATTQQPWAASEGAQIDNLTTSVVAKFSLGRCGFKRVGGRSAERFPEAFATFYRFAASI